MENQDGFGVPTSEKKVVEIGTFRRETGFHVRHWPGRGRPGPGKNEPLVSWWLASGSNHSSALCLGGWLDDSVEAIGGVDQATVLELFRSYRCGLLDPSTDAYRVAWVPSGEAGRRGEARRRGEVIPSNSLLAVGVG